MAKKQNSVGSRGFVLTEVLVVLPIMVIICLFLAYLIMYQYWVFNTQTAELTIANDARSALEKIDTHVRGANRVVASYSGYTTGSQTLIVRIPSIDSSATVITGVYDNVVFYLSGTDLMMHLYPGTGSSRSDATQTIAQNVDTANFAFTYDNADYSLVTSVTTTMALSSSIRTQMGSKTRSLTLSSQTKLRDY